MSISRDDVYFKGRLLLLTRRKGFFLGFAIFWIVAVGTLAVSNKLFGLVLFSIIDIEQPTDSFPIVVTTAFVAQLLLTIGLSVITTRTLLLRFP